jgi:mannose-6-phosphate isomerase-like protein (cupin superfamily)
MSAIAIAPSRVVGVVVARDDLTVTRAAYGAGERVAGPHIHERHTDAFYVLEGELIFELGPEADTVTVGPGEVLAAPPGLAHSFRVADDHAARWLTIHAPDGGFADFIRGLHDGVHVEWDIAPVPLQVHEPA